MGIDQSKVDALLARARREVDEGLLPSTQVALAYQGELVAFEAFGDADPDTRYVVFSATKAFVAATVWALIGDGLVDPSKRVVEYIPEFATNGKDVITVEQVMLHTAGFPHAPLGAPDWWTREGSARSASPSGGSTGSPAHATSTTRRRPTGCSPRSSSASPAATSATTSSAGSPARSACRACSASPRTAGRRRRARAGRRARHGRRARGDLRRQRAARHRGDAGARCSASTTRR